MAHASDPSVFDVTDYESYRDSNNPNDDGPLFRAAISDAKDYVATNGVPATVEIPSGTYTIGPDPANNGAHLKIALAEMLTIKGIPDATLIMTDWQHDGMVISASREVSLENITIDYDPLAYTQGTITSVDTTNKYIYMDIDSGFPLPTADPFVNSDIKGYVYTDDNIDGSFNEHRIYYPTLVTGLNYRLTSLDSVTTDLVGHDLVLSTRGGTKAIAVVVTGSELNEDPNNPGEHLDSVTVKNVTVNASPTGAFNCRSNDGMVTLEDCNITAPTGRLLSTNADGLHARWNRAPINLIGCDFSRMGDDAVNITGSYQGLLEQTSANVIYVEQHAGYYVNDHIRITNPETGELITEATITAVSKGVYTPTAGTISTKITVAETLPTLSSVLTPLSGRSEADEVINLDLIGAGSQIIGNSFGNNRARGIMLRCDNALIEGNYFYQLDDPAIVIGEDFAWREGPGGDGAIIRNNVFENINRSNIVIQIAGATPPAGYHDIDDIVIEGNDFFDYGRASYNGRGNVGTVLYVEDTENLQFLRNTIGAKNEDAVITDPVTNPVYLNNSGDLALLNNNFFEYTGDQDWLDTGSDVEQLHITNQIFNDRFSYGSETELDAAWSTLATLGGNPLRLGTNSSISADEPFAMVGNTTVARDLEMTIRADWHLSFDMIHTAAQRSGFIGLLDASLEHGYLVQWSSGASTGIEGTISIKEMDLSSPLNSWSETGATLSSASSGHLNTTLPFAHIELSWEASTGTLTAYVDGVAVTSTTDTTATSFSKIVMRGNGTGAEGASIYYDNIIVNTEAAYYQQMDYASETELDADWTQAASQGGNPLRLGTNTSISADQPFMMLGNATFYQELDKTITSDWQLSFEMIHTSAQRLGWIGLLDDSGQSGYVVSWASGGSTGDSGTVYIRKVDLASELSSWYETGTSLASGSSGHSNTTLPFAQFDLTWEASTGTLTVWVDGSQVATATDTDFAGFSRIYVRGNGSGAEGESIYYDNIELTTLP